MRCAAFGGDGVEDLEAALAAAPPERLHEADHVRTPRLALGPLAQSPAQAHDRDTGVPARTRCRLPRSTQGPLYVRLRKPRARARACVPGRTYGAALRSDRPALRLPHRPPVQGRCAERARLLPAPGARPPGIAFCPLLGPLLGCLRPPAGGRSGCHALRGEERGRQSGGGGVGEGRWPKRQPPSFPGRGGLPGRILGAAHQASTPLHWAALYGNAANCTVLAAAGADLGAQTTVRAPSAAPAAPTIPLRGRLPLRLLRRRQPQPRCGPVSFRGRLRALTSARRGPRLTSPRFA